MSLNLSADELLTTTRSVRKRLDFDRPVDRAVVTECLDIALQAPSGSNSQGWQWMFVTDPDRKLALAEIYRKNWELYTSAPQPRYEADDVRRERMGKVVSSAAYLAQHFERAPIIMIPCIEGKPDSRIDGFSQGLWGSILPAVWSFMLALRERELGSAWTTLHLMNGGEAAAAELLGIPHECYSQAGMFPIAYTKGTEFKRAARLAAADVTHWNDWQPEAG